VKVGTSRRDVSLPPVVRLFSCIGHEHLGLPMLGSGAATEERSRAWHACLGFEDMAIIIL